MALTTYQDLKQALIDWPDLQGETDLTSYADTLITLGEARINVTLRLKRSLKTVTVNGSGIFRSELPVDFMEVDQVQTLAGVPLEYATPDQVALHVQADSMTEPCYYAIDGLDLTFAGAVDGYVLRYYPAFEPLSQTDTNWLYKLSPGLYLYSALIEAAIFSKESEQETARYHTAFERAAAGVKMLDWDSGAPKSQPIVSRRG